MESGEDAKPKLRGKGLSSIQSGISNLRGKLVGTGPSSEIHSPMTPEQSSFFVGSRVVQRDGGGEFIVMAIRELEKRTVVNLASIDGKQRITLNRDEFDTKLKTEGSPWKLK